MGIKTTKDGKFKLDVRVGLRRIRKKFDRRGEAEKFLVALRKKNNMINLGVEIDREINGMPLKDAILEYDSIEGARKAKVTRDNEKHWFQVMFDYMCDRDIEFVSQIGLLDLQSLQSHLRHKNELSAASVNRFFNCYRHFFNKSRAWGWITKDPTLDLPNLATVANPRKAWSDEQVGKALELALKDPTFPEWFHQTIYTIAVVGARPIEVRSLNTVTDLDFVNRRFALRSKKGSGEERVRWLPMTEELEKIFSTAIKNPARRRVIGKYHNTLFLTEKLLPVSKQNLIRNMNRLTKKLGMKGYTLYGFRHGFVTSLLEKDVNVEKIRRVVGHTNLKTLIGYSHVSEKYVRDTITDSVISRGITIKEGSN